LTWDPGRDAEHKQFTVDTGVQVYFLRPQEPLAARHERESQRALRQYYPKEASLRPCTQQDLDEVAANLNTWPRETLGFRTPARKFASCCADPLSPPALASLTVDALQRLARETVDGVLAWQLSAVEAVEVYGQGSGVLVF
jgi:hypothetical protein